MCTHISHAYGLMGEEVFEALCTGRSQGALEIGTNFSMEYISID